MNTHPVSVVVPGRNCAQTIRSCLGALVPLLKSSNLREIIFVDDGSTDDTAKMVAEFPVICVAGNGKGPGAARNIGWRRAQHPLVWFVDADCVAQPDALERLLPHFDEPPVGGVSGSYGIMNPESLLACLVHEEIIERHRRMPQRVDFLATFNVVYRRDVLEQVGGFDERYLKAQDAELAFRVISAGHELRFVFDSRVNHYHPDRWRSYLQTQRQQGYWRVLLHLSHRGHSMGDSYSSIIDHLQPPLAILVLTSSPLLGFGRLAWMPVGLLLLLLMAQVPMTIRLLWRLRRFRFLCYAAMSFLRSFWRGIGMTHGLCGHGVSRLRRSSPDPSGERTPRS